MVSPTFYSTSQRAVALCYGLGSHALFLASVAVMFISLYQGLHFSLFHLHGWTAILDDVLLILQFGVGHSLLLSEKGRRWLSRLAPMGLGRELSTTIFAGIASLQLLITFLLWSSSEVIWVVPEGWLKGSLSLVYGVSWLLLAKSMMDAGLDVQIGILGWRSVWQGKAPVYRPFTRRGLFKNCRQPIYLSFTLILWSAPVWTPDHLLLALGWTGYCVIAPLWKEKRYLKYYGQAYARYQRRVPYWFPGRHRSVMHSHPETSLETTLDAQVIIVGAGPVGMLLGCLLGERGIRTILVESRTGLPTRSQAIGITPPSLGILKQAGLDTSFVAQGLPIHECHVHGRQGLVGTASFRSIGGSHPYVLSIPQQVGMTLLEAKLKTYACVQVRRGLEFVSSEQNTVTASVKVRSSTGESDTLNAAFVIGCDGHRSRVREGLKMRTRRLEYGHHFLMGDFRDHSLLGQEAHLFFTPQGAVESFPLPDGLRRWIVQTNAPVGEAAEGFLAEVVRQRSGHQLNQDDQVNQSSFSPWRLDCEQIYDGRVLLCGDAAHVMSPIGGQGMNTGFADAEFAAVLLEAVLQHGEKAELWLEEYDRCRRKAASTAASRAALGMQLGTWRGEFKSRLRDFMLRHIVLGGPLKCVVGPWFAMMTIPFNRAFKSSFVSGYLRKAARTAVT